MKSLVTLLLPILIATPGYAKTHKEIFDLPCAVLWPAVKDTLRNSGKYGIIGIDNTEMTASYNMGGNMAVVAPAGIVGRVLATGKRINSLVLNAKGNSCELQVQTAFSGIANNDAGDLRKRVQESLDKPKGTSDKPAPAGIPADQNTRLTGNPLTNRDIMSLKQAGLSDQLLIDKIRSSPAKFSLETSDLIVLRKAGVSDVVVSAMLEASRR